MSKRQPCSIFPSKTGNTYIYYITDNNSDNISDQKPSSNQTTWSLWGLHSALVYRTAHRQNQSWWAKPGRWLLLHVHSVQPPLKVWPLTQFHTWITFLLVFFWNWWKIRLATLAWHFFSLCNLGSPFAVTSGTTLEDREVQGRLH